MMQRDKAKGWIGSGDKLPGVRYSGSASFTLVIRHLKVQITMERQMQQNSAYDPFINQLANWEQPGGLYFEQTRMRKHLMHCLEAQYLSTFPIVRKRRRAAKSKLSSTIRLYCSCRMLEIAGRTMIQCCACKEWLHVGICVTVPNEALDTATKWFCNNCT